MTNESIFYIIGLILGGVLGYMIRGSLERKRTKITIFVKNNKNER